MAMKAGLWPISSSDRRYVDSWSDRRTANASDTPSTHSTAADPSRILVVARPTLPHEAASDRPGHGNDDDVGQGVESDGDEPDMHQLRQQRHAAVGRLNELGQEREEEGRGLRIERFDEDALTKASPWTRRLHPVERDRGSRVAGNVLIPSQTR